jgi:hypothetical protein
VHLGDRAMELTINAPVIATLVTMLANFAVLVWAASSFASKLHHLARALSKLTTVLEAIDIRVQNHEVRLSVLENRGGRRMEDPQP